jgi:parallel beta helix pectate lyase-like protein
MKVSTIALILFSLIPIPAAARPIVVGTGTPESCFEEALELALQIAAEEGGGRIQFDCGAAPTVISIGPQLPGAAPPMELVVPDHTTIDGADLITFTGRRGYGFFISIAADAKAEIRNVTIQSAGLLTSAIWNLGTLDVVHCAFVDNRLGAIGNRGELRIKRSLFTKNGRDISSSGSITNGGLLIVDHTSFVANTADGGGAGIDNFGVATVRNSVFTKNYSHWVGGAFDNRGDATIQNCEFSNNGDDVAGGALANEGGTLVVRNSLITGNSAFLRGGGLIAYNGTVTRLVNTVVTQNEAQYGGGVYILPGGRLVMIAGTVSANIPDDIVQ